MSSDTRQAWALGGTIFGATAMLVVGVFQVMIGIAALANDSLFVVSGGYTYLLDMTMWGWIHVIVGGLAIITGLFLYTGSMWARGVGIGLAAVVAVANFVFLPYYPLWAIVVIALAIFVIWSLGSVSMTAGVNGRSEVMMDEGDRSRGRDWSSMNKPSSTMNEPMRHGDRDTSRHGDVESSRQRDMENASHHEKAEGMREAERHRRSQ